MDPVTALILGSPASGVLTYRMSRRDCAFGAEPRVDYDVGGRFIGWKIWRVEGGVNDVGEKNVFAQARKLVQETVLGQIDGVMLVVAR